MTRYLRNRCEDVRVNQACPPREKFIIPRAIHVSVLLVCVYFAVFDVPFGSILPTLVKQGFNASLEDDR